jgi:hypothetical protein
METLGSFSPAFKAIGSIMTGESEAKAFNQQADQLKGGAAMSRRQGGVREDMIRRSNARKLAEQRAAYAQSGFDPNSGSLNVQGESAGNAELDALTSRYETELQAIGMLNQAAGLNAQAKNARRQGYLNAAGTIIEAGANYFGMPRLGAKAPVENRDIPRSSSGLFDGYR